MPDILGRLRSPRLAGAPATPQPGEMYYNSTSNVLYYWNGTSWVTSGATGGGTPVLAAAAVLDVGVLGQIRAGRQLTAADFTALGLSRRLGLWNLSDLTDASGNGRALSNKGAVAFASGINGAASTAAQFTGSTGAGALHLRHGWGRPVQDQDGIVGVLVPHGETGGQSIPMSASSARRLRQRRLTGRFNNNACEFVIPNVSDGTTTARVCRRVDVADDRWHFVVATHDGAQVRLYVDAVLESVARRQGCRCCGRAAEHRRGWRRRLDRLRGFRSTAASTRRSSLPTCSQTIRSARSTARRSRTGSPAPRPSVKLAVRRARKGGPLAVGDFPTQPLRLHNFTAGALTDQGSNNAALTNNGAALIVVGADGAQGGAFNFVTASSQSLSSTDAGLPSGTAARSYGCWFKTSSHQRHNGCVRNLGKHQSCNGAAVCQHRQRVRRQRR